MANPPSSLPEWASAGGADITEPSEAQKDAGWADSDIPPNEWVNWWWNLVYQWIAHLAGASAKYLTLEDAVAGLSAGDTAIVDEHDLDSETGTLNASAAPGANVVALDGDGAYLVYSTGGDPVRVARDDLGTVLTTYTKTNAGTVASIRTDGVYVVAAYGQYLECWDVAGTSQWVYDHGATVNDCCLDSTRAYLAGDAGTGTHHARAITIATGLSAWDYDHGGNLEAIDTDGKRVVIAGAVSGHASGAHVRALRADNGFDATNEGGTGADTTAVAWDQVIGNPVLYPALRLDSHHVYLPQGAGVNELVLGIGDGATVATLSGTAGTSIALDQDLLILGASAVVRAYDKRTLALVWGYIAPANVLSMFSDGTGVFTGITTGSGDELRRLYRGNRARVWRRVDPSADAYIPYRQLIIPEEY